MRFAVTLWPYMVNRSFCFFKSSWWARHTSWQNCSSIELKALSFLYRCACKENLTRPAA